MIWFLGKFKIEILFYNGECPPVKIIIFILNYEVGNLSFFSSNLFEKIQILIESSQSGKLMSWLFAQVCINKQFFCLVSAF